MCFRSDGQEILTSGRDGQLQPQSTLEILQQQLESFQTLQQQTLENVSMVQTEIHDILNKNLTDMKSPDNLHFPTTSINITTPREYQEALYFKKQLHPDKKSDTSHGSENKFSSEFKNRILNKYKATGISENHTQESRNKAVLSLNNDDDIKNFANSTFSPSYIGLGSEKMPHLKLLKKYNEHKPSTVFHNYEREESLADNVSPFKDLKEEDKKASRHELSHILELQNSNNVCGKDNDSGYLSEQDLIEKIVDMSNYDFKLRRFSELGGSTDEFQTVTASSSENYQSTLKTAGKDKYKNKEHLLKDSATDKLQINLFSKVLKKNETQLLKSNQELQNYMDLEFSDINSVPDDYAESRRLLHLPLGESDYCQKKEMILHEDMKIQMKPLADVIQCLTEQNSKYQNQIKELHDENNNLQGKLVKSEGDSKECLKELKRLLKKCKELQQQKLALEEKQDQLYDQNQRIMRDVNYFQKKDQKAQESLAIFSKEKSNLIATLGSLENKVLVLQEEKKTLGDEICQLKEEKQLLGKELGQKQNEIQKMKENEKIAVSDMEAVLRMLQSFKDEKLNCDKTLHVALSSQKVLEKELQDAQTDRAQVEEKLLTERKNAKIESGVLKTTLSNTERECDRLRTMITTITEDNKVLKKQLNEFKQETYECKHKIRQLSETLLLKENVTRSIENERDALRFEAQRLQKNNANLKEQVTTLANEQYKQECKSRSQKKNDFSLDSTQICEEISRYQHISLMRDLPEYGKIAEIQTTLEEELSIETSHGKVKNHYSTFTISCSNAITGVLDFPVIVWKKCSIFCSAP
ncbi:coiled-coil domain-containing protein 110 isoform X3 [Pantherophis guttatus]|uniref:Coiled-coil domain-containing protein 110 isoform X3 n=1 Tax=Pantherophis guttatus TaxID=94885 RepID=A0A6P9E673_PANGU|nr:coiled-coil domain-containing protein 110 isoform X3 [Pantherophis guttatus]